jgi:hypothetical protein
MGNFSLSGSGPGFFESETPQKMKTDPEKLCGDLTGFWKTPDLPGMFLALGLACIGRSRGTY